MSDKITGAVSVAACLLIASVAVVPLVATIWFACWLSGVIIPEGGFGGVMLGIFIWMVCSAVLSGLSAAVRKRD